MIIKKRDVQLRFNLFNELNSFNEQNPDKKIVPYEVLRNLAYLKQPMQEIESQRVALLTSFSDGKKHAINQEGVVRTLKKDEDLKEGETDSMVGADKFNEYATKFNDLMAEDIELKEYLIKSESLKECVEKGLIEQGVAYGLIQLGYIQD